MTSNNGTSPDFGFRVSVKYNQWSAEAIFGRWPVGIVSRSIAACFVITMKAWSLPSRLSIALAVSSVNPGAGSVRHSVGASSPQASKYVLHLTVGENGLSKCKKQQSLLYRT
jgi:uncharacterized membrane protein